MAVSGDAAIVHVRGRPVVAGRARSGSGCVDCTPMAGQLARDGARSARATRRSQRWERILAARCEGGVPWWTPRPKGRWRASAGDRRDRFDQPVFQRVDARVDRDSVADRRLTRCWRRWVGRAAACGGGRCYDLTPRRRTRDRYTDGGRGGAGRRVRADLPASFKMVAAGIAFGCAARRRSAAARHAAGSEWRTGGVVLDCDRTGHGTAAIACWVPRAPQDRPDLRTARGVGMLSERRRWLPGAY